MATPWLDIETPFWTRLNAVTAYTDLNLTEYRTYDGNLFPWDKEGAALSTAKLPAIICELTGAGGEDFGQGGRVDRITLGWWIKYAVTSGSPGRAASEAAVSVVTDALDSRAGRLAVQSGGTIMTYEMSAPRPTWYRGTDNRPAQWGWFFEIQVQGGRRQIA